MKRKDVRKALYAILGLLAAWGLWGVFMRFRTGHELADYGSYVPWGLWVSAYIYFVGLSAGAFLLSSLVFVFRIERLKRLARPALVTAAITLFMALFCIWFDLGHMWRFWEIFTRPNFGSLMAWMVWLYSAYFLLILSELWLEMRDDLAGLAREGGRLSGLYRLLSLGYSPPAEPEGRATARAESERKLRTLGALGIPLAIAFHGGVGALFAGLLARPYWNSALYPILFLTGALVSGGALLLAITGLGGLSEGDEGWATMKLLANAVLGLLVLDLILEWAELSIPMWYRVGEEYELFRLVLFGQFWWVFWIFHILLGTAIPLFLLARRKKTRLSLAAAGGLIALTFMAVRLNIVVPGQVTPQLAGLERSYQDMRLSFEYLPSMFEWSVVAFVVAMGAVLYLVVSRYLPIRGAGTAAHR